MKNITVEVEDGKPRLVSEDARITLTEGEKVAYVLGKRAEFVLALAALGMELPIEGAGIVYDTARSLAKFIVMAERIKAQPMESDDEEG